MKLLYIHNGILDSEYANVIQVANMCEAFSQCGVEVTMAIGAPNIKVKEPKASMYNNIGHIPSFEIVTYPKFTFAGRLEIFGSYIGVSSLLRNFNADLCFVRDPFILRLLINEGIPTIFESHNSRLHNRNKLLNILWEKDVLSNTHNPKLLKFVTISRALAEFWLNKGVPKEKIEVMHDGFNLHLFESPLTQDEARRKTGLPLNKKIVAYAGRLYEDRGVEWIIELARQNPDVCFAVIGGPDERKVALEKKSNELNIDNILWLGQVPHVQIPDYLFAADILLMIWSWQVPTINYCSPLKMFEYMASGRIIVGQAFPTIGEVLVDQETAFLADPNSFEDLRGKLSQALNEPNALEMASKARKLAFAEYSWVARAGKILESVDGLV
jgi:glycosyltransferase involved in cell wall biosynthesis